VPVLSLPLSAGRKHLPRNAGPFPRPPKEPRFSARRTESTLARAVRGGAREGRHRGGARAGRGTGLRRRPTSPAPRARPECNPGPEQRAVSRPKPDQLGTQSQSFSRGYGSSLPTSLTYRLEAVHLGDQMRIWVRSGVKVRFLSNAARIFKCCAGGPRTRQEPPRSSGPRPSLRMTRISQGPRPLNQKRKLFPGPRPAASPGRQRLAARPRLCGRATPHVQVPE
jgi:hypothetical protein